MIPVELLLKSCSIYGYVFKNDRTCAHSRCCRVKADDAFLRAAVIPDTATNACSNAAVTAII